jgi:hypothetical protein
MRHYSILSLFVILIALPRLAVAAELFGTIRYQGSPLRNIEITVQGKKYHTNAHGYYSIKLDPGIYTLEIRLPDGKTREQRVNVFSEDTEKNLRLE